MAKDDQLKLNQKDPYRLVSSDKDFESLLKDETLFSQANGSLGTRNHFAEGYGTEDFPITLMNGFYDRYPLHYEENYKVFPQVAETIVNLPDGSRIELIFNGLNVNLTHMNLIDVKRVYDLKSGKVIRSSTYHKNDLIIDVIEEKIISNDMDMIVTKLTVKANQKGYFDVYSKLRMPIVKKAKVDDPRLSRSIEHLKVLDSFCSTTYGKLNIETLVTHQKLTAVMTHDQHMDYELDHHDIMGHLSFEKADEFTLTKYITYFKEEEKVSFQPQASFDEILGIEKHRLDLFWETTNVEITNPLLNRMIKFNMFMLNQHSPKHGYGSIAAKGISGLGYEGHYFWDTEVYMLPYFILTNPEKAKALLIYRYHMLDDARAEARNLGVKRGAKMPWRTISGKECSPYYPAGSAQIHINSDIALAYINTYYATLDESFMMNYGVEFLLETGLFLIEYGHFKDSKFHLYGVTGPDEYTALVNDNFYTNKMASIHLEFIYTYVMNHLDTCQDILKRLNIDEEDLKTFKKAYKGMTFLTDDSLEIIKQDDSFLDKKELDINDIPKAHFPLLLNYHPLYIYKHQILKQADTVLALALTEDISYPYYEKTVDYYLKRTTHDSSLSKCAYGIAKYQLNRSKLAFEYFEDVATLDFKDSKKHTKHGLHMANAGGSYLMVIYGLLGLRFDQILTLNPVRQTEIDSLKVKIIYQQTRMEIWLHQDMLRITTDQPMKIKIKGDLYDVGNQLNLGIN